MEEEIYEYDSAATASASSVAPNVNLEELMQQLSQERHENSLRAQRERELFDEFEEMRAASQQQREELARLQRELAIRDRSEASKELVTKEKAELQQQLSHVQAELNRTTVHLMKFKQEVAERHSNERQARLSQEQEAAAAKAAAAAAAAEAQNAGLIAPTPLSALERGEAGHLAHRLNAAEEEKMQLEKKVRRLQDLLDEERLANEDLSAQLKEKRERDQAKKKQQEEEENTSSLADELGGAFGSAAAAQPGPEIEELRKHIASLHAERESILEDFRKRDQEKKAQQEEADRHRRDLEEKFKVSQADLELERARRAEAERNAKGAWEQSQKLLKETQAAEDMKRHLAELEAHQGQQRSLIATLEDQLKAQKGEEQGQQVLRQAVEALETQLRQARGDLERTTLERETELSRHRQESEEFQRKSLEEIQEERRLREEVERKAKDAWEKTQAETAAMRNQLHALQTRMSQQSEEIARLEAKLAEARVQARVSGDAAAVREVERQLEAARDQHSATMKSVERMQRSDGTVGAAASVPATGPAGRPAPSAAVASAGKSGASQGASAASTAAAAKKKADEVRAQDVARLKSGFPECDEQVISLMLEVHDNDYEKARAQLFNFRCTDRRDGSRAIVVKPAAVSASTPSPPPLPASRSPLPSASSPRPPPAVSHVYDYIPRQPSPSAAAAAMYATASAGITTGTTATTATKSTTAPAARTTTPTLKTTSSSSAASSQYAMITPSRPLHTSSTPHQRGALPAPAVDASIRLRSEFPTLNEDVLMALLEANDNDFERTRLDILGSDARAAGTPTQAVASTLVPRPIGRSVSTEAPMRPPASDITVSTSGTTSVATAARPGTAPARPPPPPLSHRSSTEFVLPGPTSPLEQLQGEFPSLDPGLVVAVWDIFCGDMVEARKELNEQMQQREQQQRARAEAAPRPQQQQQQQQQQQHVAPPPRPLPPAALSSPLPRQASVETQKTLVQLPPPTTTPYRGGTSGEAMLAARFPNYDREVLRSVLEMHGQDTTKALNFLLQESGAGLAPSASRAGSVEASASSGAPSPARPLRSSEFLPASPTPSSPSLSRGVPTPTPSRASSVSTRSTSVPSSPFPQPGPRTLDSLSPMVSVGDVERSYTVLLEDGEGARALGFGTLFRDPRCSFKISSLGFSLYSHEMFKPVFELRPEQLRKVDSYNNTIDVTAIVPESGQCTLRLHSGEAAAMARKTREILNDLTRRLDESIAGDMQRQEASQVMALPDGFLREIRLNEDLAKLVAKRLKLSAEQVRAMDDAAMRRRLEGDKSLLKSLKKMWTPGQGGGRVAVGGSGGGGVSGGSGGGDREGPAFGVVREVHNPLPQPESPVRSAWS